MNGDARRTWSQILPLVAGAVLVLGFVLAIGFALFVYLAFSAGSSRGTVEDRAEWPEPVRALLAKANQARIDVEPVRVYRVVDFTEKYYYWRMRSSPELVDLMTNDWNLAPGTQSDLDRFWLRWPSGWEGGGKQPGQKFLGNYQKPSDNFIVIVNESQPVLYGFYYFNF